MIMDNNPFDKAQLTQKLASANLLPSPPAMASTGTGAAPATDDIMCESADLIRVIQQFLKENNLTESLRTLQEESGVSLNAVDSIEGFVSDINCGKWDAVLRQVSNMRLPQENVVELFEHIVLEMIELREIDTARSILRTSEAMQVMKVEESGR